MTKLSEQKSINWKQELLDSQRFNKKEEKLLKEGAKSLTESWYLSALYMRYKSCRRSQKHLLFLKKIECKIQRNQ